MPVAISTTRGLVSESFAVPDPGGAPVGVESLAGIDQVREFGPISTSTGWPFAGVGETCPRAHNENRVSAKASQGVLFIERVLKIGSAGDSPAPLGDSPT